MIEFCRYCNSMSASIRKKDNLDIVDRVAQYVEENYMNPLKIQDIAEKFFVNPAYLGQQFIKKKNHSLNHFINSVRIDKSREC